MRFLFTCLGLLFFVATATCQVLSGENATDRMMGPCYELDGEDDYIDLGLLDVSDDFSFSVWLKPAVLQETNRTIFSIGSNCVVNINRLNRELLVLNPQRRGVKLDSVAVAERSWQHFVFSYQKGKSLTVFQNGQQKDSTSWDFGGGKRSIRIKVGGFEWKSHFKGRMAKPKLYKKRLDAEEVKLLYGSTSMEEVATEGLSYFSGRTNKALRANILNADSLVTAPLPGAGGVGLSFPASLAGGTPSTGKVLSGNSGTVAAWVAPVNVQAIDAIVNVGNAFVLRLNSSGRLMFTTPNTHDHHSTRIRIPTDRPSHIAVTFLEKDSVRFYFNGENAGAVPMVNLWREPEMSLELGSDFWNFDFEGLMWDVGYWTRELSPSEIRLLRDREGTFAGLGIPEGDDSWPVGWLIALATVIGVLLLFVGYKYFRSRTAKPRAERVTVAVPQTVATEEKEEQGIREIRLFGEFYVPDAQGENLAKGLPPKLREIFVYLFLKCLHGEPATTQELNDAFWPGYSSGKSKNNRGVSIRRIREALEQGGDVNLVFEDGRRVWEVKVSEALACDYSRLVALTDSGMAEAAHEACAILAKGRFIPFVNNEALDTFRSRTDDLLRRCFDLWGHPGSGLSGNTREKLLRVLLKHDPYFEECAEALAVALDARGQSTEARKVRRQSELRAAD
ncbi:LamG-like jellyroll fold domain-containing protein [Fulvitalea axinellae]